MADPGNPSTPPEILTLTAQIVVAHVAANTVPAADVPALINAVYGALIHADAPKVQPQEPAVPIKQSIQREYLVCLEDGAKLQSMKRYLQAQFGLTPDAYRAKWGLPLNYPMVAPAYAAKRSELAKHLGLGTALRTAERSTPEVPHLPIKAEEPTVPTPEAKHTATSVFANFPGSERPAEEATVTRASGRKRFAQQSVQVRRRQSSKAG